MRLCTLSVAEMLLCWFSSGKSISCLRFPGALVTFPGPVKYTLKHSLPSCFPSTPFGTLDTPSGIIKFYYSNGGDNEALSRKVKEINDTDKRHLCLSSTSVHLTMPLELLHTHTQNFHSSVSSTCFGHHQVDQAYNNIYTAFVETEISICYNLWVYCM